MEKLKISKDSSFNLTKPSKLLLLKDGFFIFSKILVKIQQNESLEKLLFYGKP
jgi:hypothetical protein